MIKKYEKNISGEFLICHCVAIKAVFYGNANLSLCNEYNIISANSKRAVV